MARVTRLTSAVLSLVLPGLGQLYLGEYARATAILVMSVSVWATAAFMYFWVGSSAIAIAASLGFVYALILVPAVREAWQRAGGLCEGPAPGDSRSYVLTMLACLGPVALQLLWQNPRFGRPAKVTWTMLVAAVLVGGLWALAQIGPALDDTIRQLRELQDLRLT
jgi:TM2 domain-containing membrane protein YozV